MLKKTRKTKYGYLFLNRKWTAMTPHQRRQGAGRTQPVDLSNILATHTTDHSSLPLHEEKASFYKFRTKGLGLFRCLHLFALCT